MPATFYCGTSRDFDGSRPMTWFTPSLYQAMTFARRAARTYGGQPRVYPVTPAGVYTKDPNSCDGYRTEHPVRATGPAIPALDTAGMRDLAARYITPAVTHGPLYVPPADDPAYARDDWSLDWDH
jgi:hypothetical protein